MPYLVLGVAVVIGLVLVVRGLAGTDPKRAIKVVKGIFIAVMVLGTIYFAYSRGMGSALLAAVFLAPLLLRRTGLASLMRRFRGPTPGQSSDVETAFLRMSLNHDSGVLDGTVLQGRFRGRRLQELELSDLLELLHECRVEDEQSAVILETYLDRIHGAGWRGGDEGSAHGDGRAGPAPGGTMKREEAYEILGLQPGASAEDIKDAHHKLMLKMHPDQGGSTYLASKINQAKDLLLRS